MRIVKAEDQTVRYDPNIVQAITGKCVLHDHGPDTISKDRAVFIGRKKRRFFAFELRSLALAELAHVLLVRFDENRVSARR